MTASLDVTDPTAATRVVSDAVDHFGRIDVLVTNAVAGFTESLALELEEFGITATIVGPGYFRTDFLDKSSAILEPATLIEDYRASNAAFRAATETANHAPQGDPNALGRLLVEIAAERKPPLHLPVGADAVQLVEQHHNSVLNDIKAWRAKSSNTAFNTG